MKNTIYVIFFGGWYLLNSRISSIFSELSNSLNEFFKTNKYAYAILDLEQYVKVNYIDDFDKQHTEYYRISGFEGVAISKEDGGKAFEEYEQGRVSGDMVDIDELDLDRLLELLKIKA